MNESTLTALWIVEEACGDRTPQAHKPNLLDLNAKYADVDIEDALAKMTEIAAKKQTTSSIY